MSYSDLRQWLAHMKSLQELEVVRGAHWHLEIGALQQLAGKKKRAPALLFNEIPGYPAGYGVLTNALDGPRRQAFTLGLPVKDYQPVEFVEILKEKMKEFNTTPPVEVKEGPVLENVHEGREINMLGFPAPFWHEGDGGRFLGTGHVVITRDPDEGWVNLGTYRIMVHDEQSLGFYIAPGRHGWMHRLKYFSQGKPCPVVISFGHDPLLFFLGCNEMPYGVSELDLAGGIKGEPIPVIKGEYSGLPIPAHAEVAIEGEAIPGDQKMEGPFGEWTGYYASGARTEPVIRVKRLMFRHNPIILGRSNATSYLKAALVWDQLEKAGVPDVRGVWFMEGGSSYLLLVVAIKQRYPGHARQAAMVATGCRAGAYIGRYTIVVDEDIDPADTRQVLWALATRSDPARSIEIARRFWSGPLDPVIPRGEKGHNSRAIIDACKPYEWKEDFPAAITIGAELKERVLSKWGHLLGFPE